MGFHMFRDMSQEFGVSIMRNILEQVGHHGLQSLCGNGMHLVTQACWMLYVFSNITVTGDYETTKAQQD
eukprot:12887927-Prorocentrum_lima.AAC.1